MTAIGIRAAPTDAAECARILADASRDRRTVRVVGGMTKSYIGDAGDIDTEVHTSELTGIVDHVPADLTVKTQVEKQLGDAAEALAKAGQFLPLDPPHADRATIGGVIAANSNGFWRARYGGVRDLLIGTRIALTDGTVVRSGGRVVKNVAGYDLNKPITGSFGTLGVIVEATLKVLPLPTASDGVVARFARGTDAFATAGAKIVKNGFADADHHLSDAVQAVQGKVGPTDEVVNAPTTILVDGKGTVRWVFRPDSYLRRLSPEEVLAAVDQYVATR